MVGYHDEVSASTQRDTRDRIITATAELFRVHGFNGTSLSQIVKASEATTGSLYHFFPDGKEELAAEVLRVSGAAYRELVVLVLNEAIDPSAAMTDTAVSAAAVLEATDFIDPCPIGTIAREVASTHDGLRQVAEEVMTSWVAAVQDHLTEAGVTPERAEILATTAVAAIEGGFVLARAQRDTAPLLKVGEGLRALLGSELPRT